MPELEPTNSPTTAPTTASVTETFKPAKIAGIACGKFTARNTAKRLPCMARKIDHIGVDGFETLHVGDHHGEEAEQERRDHFRDDAETEPDDEQRRDRD